MKRNPTLGSASLLTLAGILSTGLAAQAEKKAAAVEKDGIESQGKARNVEKARHTRSVIVFLVLGMKKSKSGAT